MQPRLPTGTVTLLFTDIEGSTRLLHALGPDAYAEALAEHRRLLRAAFTANGGAEIDTQGDSFFVAFPTATGAAAAALDAQTALETGPVRVRVGLHTGTPTLTDEGYVGVDVHRGARVAGLAHGGQVLLTEATRGLLPDASELTDLGLHRLKDFEEGVRILQLGGGSFAPLRTPGAISLPTPTTRFLGRERELFDAVVRWFDRDPRVLTVIGPGGTGKTRFTLELARLLAEEADGGTVFVPLASVRDPEYVVPAVAERLGAVSADVAAIAARVGDRRTHVLLDNLEQLLPEVAPRIAELVDAAPALRLLITSREPLRVAGETEFDLPPLHEDEGVTLFLERAQATAPELTEDSVVHDLVRSLDGLPLALELAAARVKLLTPRQLLDRLGERLDLLRGSRDADERHATLRATIAWSYDLLEPTEQSLFARLAVFRGGFTLDRADQICDAELDTLSSLLDKSLLRRRSENGAYRLWMLETIREFAQERLEASGERSHLERRKLSVLIDAFANDVEYGFGSDSDLNRVAPELDDIRASLEWALDSALVEGLELATALEGYWVVRAPGEGESWLRRFLDANPDAPPTMRASALRALGGAVEIGGGFARVGRLYTESAELFEAEGNAHKALHMRFRVVANQINRASHEEAAPEGFDRFERKLAAMLEQFRELDDEWGEVQVLTFIGRIARATGDLRRALELQEQSTALAHRIGWTWWEMHGVTHLAEFARRLGELDAAERYARTGLAGAIRLGDRMVSVYAAAELAAVAAARGNLAAAGRLWGAIEAEEAAAPIGQWPAERADYASLIVPEGAPRGEFERARVEGHMTSLAAAAGLPSAQTEP